MIHIYWNSVTIKTIASSDSDNDYGLKEDLDLEVFILDGPEPEPEPEPYQLYMLVFDRFYNELDLKIINFYGEQDPIDIGEYVNNNAYQSTPLSINDIRFVTGLNGNSFNSNSSSKF